MDALRVELNTFEDEVFRILDNQNLALRQKQMRIQTLFKRNQLTYHALLRMHTVYRMRTENNLHCTATQIVEDLLTSQEFEMLSLFLLSIFIFAGEPWSRLLPFTRLAVPGYFELISKESSNAGINQYYRI